MLRKSTSEPDRVGRDESGWVLDAHAHVYPGFESGHFLDAAARNFGLAPRKLGVPARSEACLLVLETRHTVAFADLPAWAAGAREWDLVPTGEGDSLIATCRGEPAMAMIRGHQLRTREGLELLLFGGTAVPPDDDTMVASLRYAADHGAAIIIPWSFGKWLARRGRTIERLLRDRDEPRFHVGDTGNRPSLFPTPRLLERARRGSIAVLPGSDPLPVRFHAGRAASSALFLACQPDLDHPLRQLTLLVRSLSGQPPAYRGADPLWRFLIAQMMLRVPAFRSSAAGARGDIRDD